MSSTRRGRSRSATSRAAKPGIAQAGAPCKLSAVKGAEVVALLLLAACGRVGFDAQGALGDAAGAGDGGGGSDVAPTIDAPGTSMTFLPAGDTYIVENSAFANNDGTNLSIGMTVAGNREVALLRFDLSPLPASTTISSATLRLVQVASMGTGTISVAVQRLVGAWDPAVVTFATRPPDDATTWATNSVLLGLQDARTWEITPLAQGWIAGTFPNLGLQLTTTVSNGTILQVGSSENTVVAQRAQLTIVVP